MRLFSVKVLPIFQAAPSVIRFSSRVWMGGPLRTMSAPRPQWTNFCRWSQKNSICLDFLSTISVSCIAARTSNTVVTVLLRTSTLDLSLRSVWLGVYAGKHIPLSTCSTGIPLPIVQSGGGFQLICGQAYPNKHLFFWNPPPHQIDYFFHNTRSNQSQIGECGVVVWGSPSLGARFVTISKWFLKYIWVLGFICTPLFT